MSWREATVAREGTHHEFRGEPLYAERFHEVLKFHEPGLAPVRLEERAWHIRPDGSAAYGRRFARTFGFYQGVAAVAAADGWHHVRPDGTDLYPARYSWCGNFQDQRCTVRDANGEYLHLGTDGEPVCLRRWRYAGDYRDGAAVVQGDDGRSTHVDPEGNGLHGQWFLDLDVYHKALARGRDAAGWMHVDAGGRPVYERRFAAVEPFYNGQARVERFDGAFEVIDVTGATIVELRPARRTEFHALSADLVGYWRTETLATGVRLGVIEALPACTARVARRCGLSPDGAGRLLDALGELGVVAFDGERWSTTARGAYLFAAHPQSLAGAAVEYAGPLGLTWKDLLAALRGEPAGRGDLFRDVAGNPERRAVHHRMLASYAAHDYPPLVPHLPIEAGDAVFDAAGGTGELARSIAEHFPGVDVVVGDLPDVLRGGAKGGVRAVGFDLFAEWPVRPDVVVLARVLHDWDDEAGACILRRAVQALRPGGRVAVVEFLRPDRGFAGALCDLHLLSTTGGRERRRYEWVQLLESAGLHVSRVREGGGVPSLLVAEPSGQTPRQGSAS